MTIPKDNLVGRQFGQLQVIGQAPDYVNPKTGKHYTQYSCRCAVCGRTKMLPAASLKRRKNPTCGCIRKPYYHRLGQQRKRRGAIKIGQRFGELEVIAEAPDHITKSGIVKPQWRCRCSCGKEIVVQQMILNREIKHDCGCKRKENPSRRHIPIRYDLSGEFGIGYTSKGEPFWFDLEDYDKIKDYRWYYNTHGVLVARPPASAGLPKQICFHQLVLGKPPKGYVVDHIRHGQEMNSPKYDNRKQNLRIVTIAQNRQNSARRRDNKSGYIGIRFGKRCCIAEIQCGKRRYKKRFSQERLVDAIEWRYMMEDRLFGAYSYRRSNNMT